MNTLTKSITVAALCAAPALQAGESPVVEYTVPQAPPAIVMPAPKPCGLGVELGASHMWASGHIMKDDYFDNAKLNTLGADLTLVYNLDENNAATLRFGYAWGHGSARDTDGIGLIKERYRLHNISIMPGYRFTTPVADSVSCFVGANVGMLNSSLKFADVWSADSYTDKLRFHGSTWGFAYSAEAGLKFNLTDNTDLFVAYQFAGSTARPRLTDGLGGVASTKAQTYHGIRAGISFKF